MSVIITLGWVIISVWRLSRMRRPSATAGASLAFFVTTLVHSNLAPQWPVSHLAVLISHMGWLVALTCTARWMTHGYYGATRPPALQGAGSVLIVAAGTVVSLDVTSLLVEVPPHLYAVSTVIFQINTLILCSMIVAYALAAMPVMRWRHRASLVCLALAAGLTFEAGLAGLLAELRNHPAPGWLSQLACAASLCYLLSLTLPLLPHRHQHPLTAADALEALWGLLSPGAPPLGIDDHSDTGPWTSDAVIAIRDRIAALQPWCPPSSLNFAQQTARRYGLSPRSAVTSAVAECLWQARRAEARHQPPLDHHASLVGLGGSRWLDDEVDWLCALQRKMALIAGKTAPITEPPDPVRSALTDPALVARCEQRLSQWLPTPRPVTMGAIRAIIARQRQRPIGVTISDKLPARALYAKVPGIDLVFLDRHDSTFMRQVAEAHELAHIICDHATTPLNPPAGAPMELPDLDADLVKSILGRCMHGTSDWQADPIEAEAELTGRILVRHLLHAPGTGLAAYLEER